MNTESLHMDINLSRMRDAIEGTEHDESKGHVRSLGPWADQLDEWAQRLTQLATRARMEQEELV